MEGEGNKEEGQASIFNAQTPPSKHNCACGHRVSSSHCLYLSACQQVEESKVIRIQLELAQVKADIDRRLHEKEEEFEATR